MLESLYLCFLAGMDGFEPSITESKSVALTTWRHSRMKVFVMLFSVVRFVKFYDMGYHYKDLNKMVAGDGLEPPLQAKDACERPTTLPCHM